MFLRDIAKRKIDSRYIMNPIDFLNAFFYNEISDVSEKLSPQDLFYILEDYLHNCANCQVTLENVLTGKVILVGFDKGLVKAYYRPQLRLNKIEHIVKKNSDINYKLNSGLEDINEYNDVEDEIIVKSGLDTREYQKMLTKY